MNILVCDPISPKGIALLQQRPEFKVTVLKQKMPETELLPLVAEAHALVVRSETKVSKNVIAAAPHPVVGRRLSAWTTWTWTRRPIAASS